jgi:hypothetical protein
VLNLTDSNQMKLNYICMESLKDETMMELVEKDYAEFVECIINIKSKSLEAFDDTINIEVKEIIKSLIGIADINNEVTID